MARWLDMFGRLIRRTPDPERLRARTVVHSIRDRGSLGSWLDNLTPGRLLSIFRQADDGEIGVQIELAEDLVERDDHLCSVDQTRRNGVAGLEWIIEAGDDTPAAGRAADAFRDAWERLEPEAVYGRMMDAVLAQWHVEQLIWDTDGRIGGRPLWVPIACEDVDSRRLIWPQTATERPGDITSIIPGIQINWTPSETDDPEPGKYIAHSYRAKRGRPGKGALVRAVAALVMFKKFSLIDLAQLLEQWGRPWPVVTYDPSATDEEVRGWLATLADTMADRAIAVPMGKEVEVIDAKAAGADTPHVNMINLSNEGISKTVVGSTTIAEAAGEGAESVSSPTHASVRRDIRNADARAVAATLYRCVAVPFTLWNFGPEVAPPKLSPTLGEKPEPASRAQVFIQAQTLGLSVQSEQVYSELGLERPEGVPEILELRASAAANPFAGLFGHTAGGGGATGITAGGGGATPQKSPRGAAVPQGTGETAVPRRAPRGAVAPGGAALESDEALSRWSDRAAAAAGVLGDEKFARVGRFIDMVERQGGRLQDVRARLHELLDRPLVEDEVELNHQATLAAYLRGRYAVARTGAATTGKQESHYAARG
jgi:phage gp29-like protein